MMLAEIIENHIKDRGYDTSRWFSPSNAEANVQFGIYINDVWIGFITIDREQIVIGTPFKRLCPSGFIRVDYETTTINQADPELLATIDQLITAAAAKWS